MQQWPQRSDEAAIPTLSQLPSLSCWSHDVNGTDSPMAFSIYELVQATHGLTGDPAQVPAPGFTQGPEVLLGPTRCLAWTGVCPERLSGEDSSGSI